MIKYVIKYTSDNNIHVWNELKKEAWESYDIEGVKALLQILTKDIMNDMEDNGDVK